jgi:arylsulfatase A-like enzyme
MISDLLASRGYNCGYVGKWHMGDDTRPGHGFQFTYTMAGGSRSYTDPEMFRNGEKVSEKGYLTDVMTREALGFLDQQTPGKPFFLSIGYLNPHTPYSGHPQKYYDMYAGANFDSFGWQPAAPNALREKDLLKDTVGNIRKCAASVTALDDQIPLLLKKLSEKRLRDNTLIVFSGDNGFLLGRHGLWSKGLASDPINMYEEVVQTPMIWNWPGRIPVEASRPELVSAYDLVPSLCDAVGIEPPSRNLCGRSYLKIAQGFPLEKKEAWRSIVFGHFRNTEMARDQRFKLVVRNNSDGPNELFDLRQDPNERTNQYDNPAFVTVRDRLSQELEQWRKTYSS